MYSAVLKPERRATSETGSRVVCNRLIACSILTRRTSIAGLRPNTLANRCSSTRRQSPACAAISSTLTAQPPGSQFSAAIDGESTAGGSASYLMQGDVLQSLAPILQVRSDYFRIRTCGEALDAGGKVVARAWCEAFVQRAGDYLDSKDQVFKNPAGLGEPLIYKGPPRLMLRTSEAEFALKPPLPAPHAWVDLPPDSGRVLLACLKSGDAPLRVISYDIGKARIGAGEYRFFNFSRSVVSAIFGEKKFAVKPGEDTLVSDASWQKEVGEIDMVMAIMKDGRAKPVYSSQWGNRPGRRNHIFVFDGPQKYKPLRICRFFDVPPSAPEKATP